MCLLCVSGAGRLVKLGDKSTSFLTQNTLIPCCAYIIGAVLTSPQITSPPQSVVAAAGGTATLICSMTGSPQPTAMWYKASGTLPAGRYSSTPSNGTLRITGLVQADSGQYYCVATSTAGSVASLNSTITVACELK